MWRRGLLSTDEVLSTGGSGACPTTRACGTCNCLTRSQLPPPTAPQRRRRACSWWIIPTGSPPPFLPTAGTRMLSRQTDIYRVVVFLHMAFRRYVNHLSFCLFDTSSGFKRKAIPIKNHDAQSLIRWSHVPFLGAPQVPIMVPMAPSRC